MSTALLTAEAAVAPVGRRPRTAGLLLALLGLVAPG